MSNNNTCEQHDNEEIIERTDKMLFYILEIRKGFRHTKKEVIESFLDLFIKDVKDNKTLFKYYKLLEDDLKFEIESEAKITIEEITDLYLKAFH